MLGRLWWMAGPAFLPERAEVIAKATDSPVTFSPPEADEEGRPCHQAVTVAGYAHGLLSGIQGEAW